MRLYLDTSVFGGYFEPEFEAWTKPLFGKIKSGDHTLLHSPLVRIELQDAPARVRELFESIPKNSLETIETNEQVDDLALEYIKAKVVGATSFADCQHIALASLVRADVLVSWNFKHIVSVPRIRGYNSVNLRLGLQLLDIRTPIELLSHGH